MFTQVVPALARIVLTCAGLIWPWTCGQAPAEAADIYGVKALGDRLVLRVVNTDQPGSARDLATITNAPGDELRGLIQLADRRIALLRTSQSVDEPALAHLAVLGMPGQCCALQALGVSGLDHAASLTHMLVAWGARYYGLVSRYNDRPPFQLATFFLGTGGAAKLTSIDLPANARYANLTQCPDGTIYATSLAPQQDTRLIKLDPESGEIGEVSQLTLNQRTLPSDIMGLACDADGALYALADPTRRGTASLFAVEAGTGVMRWRTDFAADKIIFVKMR